MPIPGVQRFQQPDYSDNTQDATSYAVNIDRAIAVSKRFSDWFAPHQVYAGSPNPDLAVEIDAGFIWNGTTLTEVAAQTVAGFTIPSAGQNRVDRIVLNSLTGVASRIAGTAVTGSPTATAPAITAGSIPVCQVVISSADTAVLNSMITDERCLVTTTSAFNTGDVKITLKTTADSGWVLMDDKTIGNAASGATGRANADTVDLFTLLWNNTNNTDCPVTGLGSPIADRGASAAADFAANKMIALPKALGRALATYGSGSGLTARTLGQTTGVETHPLTTAELATHSHGVTDAGHVHNHISIWQSPTSSTSGYVMWGDSAGQSGQQQTADNNTTGISINNNGSGTAHQNMQPTLFLNTMIKL